MAAHSAPPHETLWCLFSGEKTPVHYFGRSSVDVNSLENCPYMVGEVKIRSLFRKIVARSMKKTPVFSTSTPLNKHFKKLLRQSRGRPRIAMA